MRPAAEVERLARRIAGEGAGAAVMQAARDIAEAEFDLGRVRRARLDMMADPDFGATVILRADGAAAGINQSRRTTNADGDAWRVDVTRAEIVGRSEEGARFDVCGPEAGSRLRPSAAGVIAAALARIDRYERSALTRRRRAIETFDAMVEQAARIRRL